MCVSSSLAAATLLRCALAVTALVAQAAPLSAQLPPPSAKEVDAERSLIAALPKTLPPQNLAALAPLVDPDLKVYKEGELKYRSRDAWFDYLRSFGDRGPNPSDITPVGVSVRAEHYYKTKDGAIMILEYLYPIAPPGHDVYYEPGNQLRVATYHLDENGRLVRVDYGPPMSDYDWLLKKKPESRPTSNGPQPKP